MSGMRCRKNVWYALSVSNYASCSHCENQRVCCTSVTKEYGSNG